MALNEQQLLNLKEEVEEAKTTVSQLTGQRTALMKQLEDDWNCKTIQEAEAKLKEIERSISTIDKKIEKGIEELEEKYNDNNNNIN